MTGCEFPFEMLSGYVDGQLVTEQELEVRRHLEGCARCRQTVDTLLEMNRAIAATAEVHAVPHALRERLSQLALSKGKLPTKWVLAAAAVIAVLLVAFGAWQSSFWPHRTGVDQLTQALIEDHVRYLKIPDAIQIASHDPQHIADSFNSRVGFVIKLPQLTGASLLGARFCWLKGHKALLSFYEGDRKRLSLFVLERNAVPAGALPNTRCETRYTYRVCLVPAASEVLALVADPQQASVIMPELEQFEARSREP